MTNIINNIKEPEQCNSNESISEVNLTVINEYDNTKDIQRIRDPFSERPVKDLALKRSVRSSRYRSTAKSRICGMSVGDIRYSFNQLRAAGDKLTSDMVLYNGSTAGSFALSYLIETSNSMRKRRKKKKDSIIIEEEPFEEQEPESQIQKPSDRKDQMFDSVMEF